MAGTFELGRSARATFFAVAAPAAIAVVATGCERAKPAPETIAPSAQSARAAQSASAAAAASGPAPLVAPPVLVEESFRKEKPSSMCSPATASPCSLDHVGATPAGEVTKVNRKDVARITGWAADGATGTVPPVVVIELAGTKKYYVTATHVSRRPDVAAATKMPALVNSGYDALAAFKTVDPGEYAVNILQVSASGEASKCETKKKLQVE
jgi:hypothetical protein